MEEQISQNENESRGEAYQRLPPLARSAIDALIALDKASFPVRSVAEMDEVFRACIEAATHVRELAVYQMNEFFSEKPLVISAEQSAAFQSRLVELEKVFPVRVLCPGCQEPGNLFVTRIGNLEEAAVHVLHLNSDDLRKHSGLAFKDPEGDGVEFTTSEFRSNTAEW